jgi:hypothetical protein
MIEESPNAGRATSVVSGRLALMIGSGLHGAVVVVTLRVVFSGDADAELRRLAEDPKFAHGDAARRALQFRAGRWPSSLVKCRPVSSDVVGCQPFW